MLSIVTFLIPHIYVLFNSLIENDRKCLSADDFEKANSFDSPCENDLNHPVSVHFLIELLMTRI